VCVMSSVHQWLLLTYVAYLKIMNIIYITSFLFYLLAKAI